MRATPRTPPPQALLEAVQSVLSGIAGGAGIDILVDRLAVQVRRRTLQRRLAAWASAGAIRAERVGNACRSLASAPMILDHKAAIELLVDSGAQIGVRSRSSQPG